MSNLVAQLSQHLFADKSAHAYAVLDGAMISDLLPNLHRYHPAYECLYRGELAPDIAEVAPYLVQLEPARDFTNWLLAHGWGHNWGIYATAATDLRALRRHFRTFLIVHDEEGKPLYFRFYDPRVLRVYLPTCKAEELKTIFGPVSNYIFEDKNPEAMLYFRAADGTVQKDIVTITQT